MVDFSGGCGIGLVGIPGQVSQTSLIPCYAQAVVKAADVIPSADDGGMRHGC